MKFLVILLTTYLCYQIVYCQEDNEIRTIFRGCSKSHPDFDICIKNSFNLMNPYFKIGIPQLNVASFDPHFAQIVEQRRGDVGGLGGYHLTLTNVSEFGWTQSNVTKYRTDKEQNRIIYSQYFPDKYLNGHYDLHANILGKTIINNGTWKLALYRYSQTTSISRIGGPSGLLKVRVAVDEIGDMKLHISNFFGGRFVLESIADFFINNAWQPSLPFIKPLINDLVSTAFTDIFNESFRYFPIDEYVQD